MFFQPLPKLGTGPPNVIIRTERMRIGPRILHHQELHASAMDEERTKGLKKEELHGGPFEIYRGRGGGFLESVRNLFIYLHKISFSS